MLLLLLHFKGGRVLFIDITNSVEYPLLLPPPLCYFALTAAIPSRKRPDPIKWVCWVYLVINFCCFQTAKLDSSNNNHNDYNNKYILLLATNFCQPVYEIRCLSLCVGVCVANNLQSKVAGYENSHPLCGRGISP